MCVFLCLDGSGGEEGEQMSKTYFMGYRFRRWHERGLKLSDIH